VKPAATLAALIPGMNYFAMWYVIGAVAVVFGIETRGRTIDEIDAEMSRPAARPEPAGAPVG
jgi:MFS transporter, putative metabolite:H+ symporter